MAPEQESRKEPHPRVLELLVGQELRYHEQVSELFTRTLSLFEQRGAKVFTQVKTSQKLLLYTLCAY